MFNPNWLLGTELPNKFANALKELQAAGRCYAFKESDACAFHSMRALEVCLRAIAAQFPAINRESLDKNWADLIGQIETAISAIGKSKRRGEKQTAKEKEDIHFYGQAALHFIFLKNGWRNHVMHANTNYNERDALQMLEHVRDLMLQLSKRLSEPVDNRTGMFG
jgi:hypothetical protein